MSTLVLPPPSSHPHHPHLHHHHHHQPHTHSVQSTTPTPSSSSLPTTTTTTTTTKMTLTHPLRQKNESMANNSNKNNSVVVDPLHARYLIAHKLSSGGYGHVFAGVRKKDGMPVALKVVPKKRVREINTPEGKLPLEVFLLRRVAKVKHVIHMLEYFIHNDQLVIVLERPERCCDLYDFICERSGGLDERLARDFFKQILQILQDVHACGVLHGDIKDENFLVDMRTGEIYLIDFGSGAVLTDGIYTDFQGTNCYAAPEWVTCRRYFGLPQTVWSLGILLYDLVCGDIPFADELAIIKCQPQFPSHLTPECIELIQRCLSIRSSERPSLEECLQSTWLKLPLSRDLRIPLAPRRRLTRHQSKKDSSSPSTTNSSSSSSRGNSL